MPRIVRNTIFYLVVLLVVGGGILGVIKLGAGLPGPTHTVATLTAETARAAPESGSHRAAVLRGAIVEGLGRMVLSHQTGVRIPVALPLP